MDKNLNSKEKRKYFKNQAIYRIGETRINTHGSVMVIDEYDDANNVWVRFLNNDYIIKTTYNCFVNGLVKSPYDKTIFGKGYLGEGKHKVSLNNYSTHQYSVWHMMLQRCYSKKFQEKHLTYKECTVCEEWHNFQNFAKWYDENYYESNEERMSLDKDILIKGNKIYSPETCVIVPQRINALFTKTDALRGKYPIGVHLDKKSNKYIALCKNGRGKRIYLGNFETPQLAFNSYKKYKEELIIQIANDYKEKIPENLYNALITYKVEFND